MMAVRTEDKARRLHEILKGFDRVAVAFSGGVDSTFLLHAACDALGDGRVTALLAVSCLMPRSALQNALRLFKRHFQGRAALQRFEFDPLRWQDFAANPPDRCYLCKKRIYEMFFDEMSKLGISTLLDGTNEDDLGKGRPGLRALGELGVATPLAESGLIKAEIRQLAKEAGLENHDLPSNSCLATRMEEKIPLAKEMLELIDSAERVLMENGFSGSRVRPFGQRTVIEVATGDIEKIASQNRRVEILYKFHCLGFDGVVLDLVGRTESR